MSPIVEDYSDLAAEEDEQWLQDKVADFKVSRCNFLRSFVEYPHTSSPLDEKFCQKRPLSSG
jgi:hypothetical protein